MKLLILLLLTVTFTANAEYTLVSAPRGDRASETKKYAPIAEELSKVLGVEVRYQYIEGWAVYTKAIYDDKYDIVFDGPQSSSYRASYKNHKFVARLAEPLAFVVVTKSSASFGTLKSLSGRPVCLHPSPNLGTMLLLNNYTVAPPATVRIEGFKAAYDGVVNGNCVAAVVPLAMAKKLNKGDMKVIHEFPVLPNQAITVSARIPNEKLENLRAHIISGKCTSCSVILETFASKGFVSANANDYLGVSDILAGDYLIGKDIRGNKVTLR